MVRINWHPPALWTGRLQVVVCKVPPNLICPPAPSLLPPPTCHMLTHVAVLSPAFGWQTLRISHTHGCIGKRIGKRRSAPLSAATRSTPCEAFGTASGTTTRPPWRTRSPSTSSRKGFGRCGRTPPIRTVGRSKSRARTIRVPKNCGKWWLRKWLMGSLICTKRFVSSVHMNQRGRTVRCARAVRKVGYFGPVSPNGQGDRGNCCVRRHMTTQISYSVQTLSDIQVKQITFRTENARLLSESAGFALWTWLGWFSSWSRES